MIETKTCHLAKCDACATTYDNGDYEVHFESAPEALTYARAAEWTYDSTSGRIVCYECARAVGAAPIWDDEDWCPGAWRAAEAVTAAIAYRARQAAATQATVRMCEWGHHAPRPATVEVRFTMDGATPGDLIACCPHCVQPCMRSGQRDPLVVGTPTVAAIAVPA